MRQPCVGSSWQLGQPRSHGINNGLTVRIKIMRKCLEGQCEVSGQQEQGNEPNRGTGGLLITLHTRPVSSPPSPSSLHICKVPMVCAAGGLFYSFEVEKIRWFFTCILLGTYGHNSAIAFESPRLGLPEIQDHAPTEKIVFINDINREMLICAI